MFKKHEKFSLTEGPVFWRIILFVIPIMLTGILQVFYSMADNIIVGRFSSNENALGAVGSTTSLTNLILNMMFGISSGTAVVVAQSFGAKRDRDVSRTVHTSLTFSVFIGIFLMAVGLLISRPALELMDTKPELIDDAVLYMRIICLGIPATSIYNFGAAILRSVGDSKTPLYILSISGILNVLLNLLFILAFNMSVDGVAYATIISQYLSAVAVVTILMLRKNRSYTFSFNQLCFDTTIMKRILRFGIPAGIQSSLFNVANILLTNGINTLPSKHTIKAYTITNNIDALTYTACNSFMQAAMTFTGQNYGAKKPERIKKILIFSIIQVTVVGLTIGILELVFSNQLSSLYINAQDPNREEIMSIARDMMMLLLPTYFLCGIMETLAGTLRGLGYSLSPMLATLACACGFRIIWRFVVFPLEKFNSPVGLLLCFPISWVMTISIHIILLTLAFRKLKKLMPQKSTTFKEQTANVN